MKCIALTALATVLTLGSFANDGKHHSKKHSKQACTNCSKTQCTPECQPQCHQMTCKG